MLTGDSTTPISSKTIEQLIEAQEFPFDDETSREVEEWERKHCLPPPRQNASCYENDILDESEGWFYHYCLPFVFASVMLALILMVMYGY